MLSRPPALSLVGPLMPYDSLSWALSVEPRLSLSFILFHSLYIGLLRGPLLPYLLFITLSPTSHLPNLPIVFSVRSFLLFSALSVSICLYIFDHWWPDRGPHRARYPPTQQSLNESYVHCILKMFNTTCWAMASTAKHHSFATNVQDITLQLSITLKQQHMFNVILDCKTINNFIICSFFLVSAVLHH